MKLSNMNILKCRPSQVRFQFRRVGPRVHRAAPGLREKILSSMASCVLGQFRKEIVQTAMRGTQVSGQSVSLQVPGTECGQERTVTAFCPAFFFPRAEDCILTWGIGEVMDTDFIYLLCLGESSRL